jgi:hypothetical protein
MLGPPPTPENTIALTAMPRLASPSSAALAVSCASTSPIPVRPSTTS